MENSGLNFELPIAVTAPIIKYYSQWSFSAFVP